MVAVISQLTDAAVCALDRGRGGPGDLAAAGTAPRSLLS